METDWLTELRNNHTSRANTLAGLEPGLPETLITDWAQQIRPATAGAGVFLFHQGDRCEVMYLIVSGEVDIVSHARSGRELVLRTLGRGDVVGELAMTDPAPRMASARPTSEVRLFATERRCFERLVDRHPALGLWLARRSAEKMRDLTHWAESRSFDGTDTRLFGLLADLADVRNETSAPNRPCPGDRSFDLRVTQQRLADRLGVSRESVNKILKTWSDAGLVAVQRRRIRVESIGRLRDTVARLRPHETKR